jgi:hypothetical protein
MRSRFCLFVALTVLPVFPALVSPALAAPRDDVKAGAARCDGIADDRTWLDCYYGAAQPMRAKLGLPPAPGSQQALVPLPVPGAPAPVLAPFQITPAESSGPPGLFARLTAHTVVKAEPPTRMKSYTFDKAGYFNVTLANGEVWQQDTTDAVQAHWRNPPQSYVVVIQPGSKMEVGGHETYTVERVQ